MNENDIATALTIARAKDIALQQGLAGTDREIMNILEQRCFRIAGKLERYSKAIELDIADAKAACGGDGEGCDTYRDYYQTPGRRHQKCGNCPMGATLHIRAAIAGEPT